MPGEPARDHPRGRVLAFDPQAQGLQSALEQRRRSGIECGTEPVGTSRATRATSARAPATTPAVTSEWPFSAFVAEWTTMSAP